MAYVVETHCAMRVIGRRDARDSTVGVHALLAAASDRHHLRPISAQ